MQTATFVMVHDEFGCGATWTIIAPVDDEGNMDSSIILENDEMYRAFFTCSACNTDSKVSCLYRDDSEAS